MMSGLTRLVLAVTFGRYLDPRMVLDCLWNGNNILDALAPDPHRFDSDNDGVGCES